MKIVFATNNPNKIVEIKDLLPEEIQILSLKDINCNEQLPETQNTLEGNAKQKAEFVFTNYGYNCFADDTGLEIESLNGEPGIYSARYAGEEKSANANMEKVINKLEGIENRNAHFKTVIALIIDGNGSGTLFKDRYDTEIVSLYYLHNNKFKEIFKVFQSEKNYVSGKHIFLNTLSLGNMYTIIN